MINVKIKCSFCGKIYSREIGRVNEAKKFGWKQYCSKKCQNQAQFRSVEKICGNPTCNKKVFRESSQLKKSKSGQAFCSRSCAAIFNNLLRRRVKLCSVCGKQFFGERKYCSRFCYFKSLKFKPKIIKVSKTQIINWIKEFYGKQKRIPLKSESSHYKAVRSRFGTWNNAIKAAGFEPNPVLFAKKCIAEDGHKCDSFTEKIIDDWLYSNNIEHQRNIPYPNSPYTADFLINGKFVEFFGLNGELQEYDKNTKLKEKLVKKHGLKLIKVYPKDLFPVNHLSQIIKI